MTYVRSGVLVQGFMAHVLDRLLAHRLPDLLPAMSPERRAEVLAARDDLRRAADAYLAVPVSVDGHADMDSADIGPQWSEDLIDTETAATILGVTERQVRRLAAAGLGTRVGGRWMFDRRAVYAERQRRSNE